MVISFAKVTLVIYVFHYSSTCIEFFVTHVQYFDHSPIPIPINQVLIQGRVIFHQSIRLTVRENWTWKFILRIMFF